MLTLIVKNEEQVKSPFGVVYGYSVVIFIDNIWRKTYEENLTHVLRNYPQGRMTTQDKLDQVTAAFNLTKDTSILEEFWETLK